MRAETTAAHSQMPTSDAAMGKAEPADAPPHSVFLGYWGDVSAVLCYRGEAGCVGWYRQSPSRELMWYDGKVGMPRATSVFCWTSTATALLRHLRCDGSRNEEVEMWVVCDRKSGTAYLMYPWDARGHLRRQWVSG